MSDAMWAAGAAVLVAIISLIGVIVSSTQNAHTAEKAADSAARKVSDLTIYRIDQLEKKVDKHNGVIDRMYHAEERLCVHEEQIKVANHRIDDLEKGE